MADDRLVKESTRRNPCRKETPRSNVEKMERRAGLNKPPAYMKRRRRTRRRRRRRRRRRKRLIKHIIRLVEWDVRTKYIN